MASTEEVKFLKAQIDFETLLETTREAVELYFEKGGIPEEVIVENEEESKKKSMPFCIYYFSLHLYLCLFFYRKRKKTL